VRAVRVYACGCERARVHECACASLRACVRSRMCTCARKCACLGVCPRAFMAVRARLCNVYDYFYFQVN